MSYWYLLYLTQNSLKNRKREQKAVSLDLGSPLQRFYFKIENGVGKVNTAVFSPPQHEKEGAISVAGGWVPSGDHARPEGVL